MLSVVLQHQPLNAYHTQQFVVVARHWKPLSLSLSSAKYGGGTVQQQQWSLVGINTHTLTHSTHSTSTLTRRSAAEKNRAFFENRFHGTLLFVVSFVTTYQTLHFGNPRRGRERERERVRVAFT